MVMTQAEYDQLSAGVGTRSKLLAQVACPHCWEWLVATSASANAQMILTLGALLFLVGLCGIIYGFNVSAAVAVDNPLFDGRGVNNLGLLGDKQNIITASGSLAMSGAVIFAAGFLRSGTR